MQEGKNQIAVKVDHSKALTGRWYTGSGIYRPVYLLVSNPTHIPYSGIHFRSKLQNKQSATYTLSIEIETQEKKPIKVKTYLQAPNGSIADTSEKYLSHLQILFASCQGASGNHYYGRLILLTSIHLYAN